MAGKASIENGKLGGRPKGTKSYKTIAKENAREAYLDFMVNELPEIFAVQAQAAKDPENFNERQYILNQAVGKAKEVVEVQGEVELKLNW